MKRAFVALWIMCGFSVGMTFGVQLERRIWLKELVSKHYIRWVVDNNGNATWEWIKYE